MTGSCADVCVPSSLVCLQHSFSSSTHREEQCHGWSIGSVHRRYFLWRIRELFLVKNQLLRRLQPSRPDAESSSCGLCPVLVKHVLANMARQIWGEKGRYTGSERAETVLPCIDRQTLYRGRHRSSISNLLIGDGYFGIESETKTKLLFEISRPAGIWKVCGIIYVRLELYCVTKSRASASRTICASGTLSCSLGPRRPLRFQHPLCKPGIHWEPAIRVLDVSAATKSSG